MDNFQCEIDGQELLVQEYPPWREAIKRFVAAQFQYGQVIERAWFYEAFGIEKYDADTPNGIAEKLKLRFLAQFTPFKIHLLTEYKMALMAEEGVGYRLVPPAEQTAVAEEELKNEILKAGRKAARWLRHVDHDRLTARERQANGEAIARLSRMAGMIRKELRLIERK